MATHVVGAADGTSRRARREALARWAPWGPRAPRPTVERRGPRLALGYLVRHAEGIDVADRSGERIGTVERVVTRPYQFWPDELVVRTDAGERLRIPAARVARAFPRRGALVVGPEPAPPTVPWTSGTRRPPRTKAA